MDSAWIVTEHIIEIIWKCMDSGRTVGKILSIKTNAG